MAKPFEYKAKDRTGQVMTGTILAENEAAVAAYIRNQGYFVTQIKEKKVSFSIHNLINLVRRVTVKDLALFCRQFATMVDAGLPLLTCLSILIEQTYNPKLKAAVQDVYRKVQEGETLSRALGTHSQVFPVIMVSMVEAGELGGVLDDVLNRLAVHFEKEHKLNEKVKSALVYPAVVIAMAALSVTFILTFVFPTFMTLFNNLKVELPLPTRILLGISQFLRNYWPIFFMAVAISTYGVVLLARQPRIRPAVDQIVLYLPIFGMLLRKIAIARFSRTLGTLVRGGVPIISALDVVKKTTANLTMINALTSAQASIRDGLGLAAPLGASSIFTPMVVQMVAIGEETGELDKMLEKIAEFYESDVDDIVSRLSSMLEPLLIGILGVVIGFIIIAVVLPLFDVITNFNRTL
ncbi:type II secretion system F family protein [Sporolituus thermophilus]|uniref:Type IV pilus assembly protein PilC n=1 Tax=Sporolituus thermophilus DSM 23256 TaxID=1123285 RepID=A0A1G7I972_9FIRM|nr:type II secretion system F family protein [Sporolituus thermophilus]SDF09066.1 type IV pilus assembly protein PilC [Sporolituus thermophilus DSM 23256]